MRACCSGNRVRDGASDGDGDRDGEANESVASAAFALRLASGSFRMVAGTSGRGARRASSSCTSRLLLPDTAATSSSKFDSVR